MSKMTTKGQVTLPKRLRDHLGLKPGSDVDFELAEDGRVFLKTHEAPQSRFARLRGTITDSSGSAIVGAKVLATNPATDATR